MRPPIIFRGEPSEEIEDFVRQIRAEVFERGKSRDDEWIADFAATCFTGNALWWYENLSPDIQGSWTLLRQALLAKYGLPPE